MKFLPIFFLILFASCGDSSTVEVPKELYDKLVHGDTVIAVQRQFSVDGVTKPISVGSDGHDYYFMSGHGFYIPVHYIECALCNSRRDSL